MVCPAYREVKNRLSEMGLKTHCQNLANYADKGYEILKLVLPALKDRALAPGSNVNVDETWERYQTHFGHRKTYMWCLVNRKANIVIFVSIGESRIVCQDKVSYLCTMILNFSNYGTRQETIKRQSKVRRGCKQMSKSPLARMAVPI